MRSISAIYLILLILSISIGMFDSSIYSYSVKRSLKILSICSDVDDLVFTHKLIKYLNELNYSIEFEILFLSKFSSDVYKHLNLLRDIWFLRKFDQIWIFDFNPKYSVIRLDYSEIKVIERAVIEGSVLIVGANTIVDNYSDYINKLTGVEYFKIESNGVRRILYMNKTYLYNSSQSKYLVLKNTTGSILGFFEPSGEQAIVLNKHGNGIVVVLAFNPVEQAVRYNNLDMYRLVLNIVIDSMNYTSGEKIIPLFDKIYYTLFMSINVYNIILYSALIYIVLEIISYSGLLPYKLVKLFIKPLVYAKLIRRNNYSDVVNVISNNPDITLDELARLLKKPIRVVKRDLAVLECRRIVSSYRDESGRKTIFRIK
ncbi:MAG: hypothetical protein QXX35_02570 [Desulfurococcaceae archaeon]